jgi:alpha-N-arabinofuranosidase
MYNVHQDATLLPLELQTVDYTFGTEKLPAISASASKDKNGVIHISLVNIDPKKAQDITLTLDGKATAVTGRVLASATMSDHNTFENPEKIKPAVFKGAQLKGNNLQVKLPACSVVVLELK